ncbi:MAG: dolichol-phosphate mannosyltransferase [Candidatus Omnitrophota bacterium]|jgi:dolichol-phosphate mannosyltransferase
MHMKTLMTSIVVPTYNEIKNIPELLSSINQEMSKRQMENYEVLIMDDDSPDGTINLVKDLEMPKVRGINRKGKPRGLSAAVIDGFEQAKGDILICMDADLSHSPAKVPELIQAILDGAIVSVGSRYVPGGGVKNWPFLRQASSRAACLVAKLVTPVKDATSGFFAVKKEALKGVELDSLGFKIGLEVFVKAKHQGRIKEVPIIFKDRTAGESKLSGQVIHCFFEQVWTLFKQKRNA